MGVPAASDGTPGNTPGELHRTWSGEGGGDEVYGSQRVTIGSNEASATVTLAVSPVVSGKLWLEDVSAVPDGAYVELENEVENMHMRRPVAKDGSFQFEAIPPGDYRPACGDGAQDDSFA